MARGPSYSDAELAVAVGSAASWRHVLRSLGLRGSSGAAIAGVRRQCERKGIDATHLGRPRATSSTLSAGTEQPPATAELEPAAKHLSKAGSLIAAAWFALSGADVAWPLEPTRYDLVVRTRDELRRVQVKTTSVAVGKSWKVYLSTTSGGRRVYTEDEIDDFFIIDGALKCYLMPLRAVSGLQAIHLSRYEQYRVKRLV